MDNNTPWTQEQLTKVADRLFHSGGNIYTIGAQITGAPIDDGDAFWDAVCKAGGIFKCEECRQWKPDSERDPDFENQCSECVGDS